MLAGQEGTNFRVSGANVHINLKVPICMPPLLELRDIFFSWKESGHPLLEHIDLVVEKGDFIIIGGLSGSGKSTILRLISRFHTPAYGTILFRGKPLASHSPAALRSCISYVAQIPVMVDGTVVDNLLLPFSFEVNKTKTPPSAHELELVMKRFYLGDVSLDHPANKLSLGQKQRLALMRAIIPGPELLLLDEPTSSLDRESATMVFSIIERLNTIEGKTIIIVTHSDYEPSLPHLKMFILRNRTLNPS